RNPSPSPAPASQDPRMTGPRPPCKARRDPGLLAQHDLICREAAPLSRSLLFEQQELSRSARANSQASFTPHPHFAVLKVKIGRVASESKAFRARFHAFNFAFSQPLSR